MGYPIENLACSPEFYEATSQKALRRAKNNKLAAYYSSTSAIVMAALSIERFTEGQQFMGISGLGATAILGLLAKRSFEISSDNVKNSEISEAMAAKLIAAQTVDKTE